jgi:hypothetical protein
MEEFIDRTDGKTVYHSETIFWDRFMQTTNTLAPTKEREVYSFLSYKFAKPYKDNRTPIIKITHSSDYEGGRMPRESHTIEFVIDPKNHGPNKQFHLNLSGLSKMFLENGECQKCKKYLYDLDHHPFSYDEYEEGKFSDLEKTRDLFFKELEKKGFHSEFPHVFQHNESNNLPLFILQLPSL